MSNIHYIGNLIDLSEHFALLSKMHRLITKCEDLIEALDAQDELDELDDNNFDTTEEEIYGIDYADSRDEAFFAELDYLLGKPHKENDDNNFDR